MKPLVVIMGVSGSGKSTVGELLAGELDVGYVDGDDLHSPENVAKMASGNPLTSSDRIAWLDLVGRTLSDASGVGVVVSCSALKRDYRDRILAGAPATMFVCLEGSRELLESRLAARTGHFMPPELLDSQLQSFEALQPDEPGVLVSVEGSPQSIAHVAAARLRLLEAG